MSLEKKLRIKSTAKEILKFESTVLKAIFRSLIPYFLTSYKYFQFFTQTFHIHLSPSWNVYAQLCSENTLVNNWFSIDSVPLNNWCSFYAFKLACISIHTEIMQKSIGYFVSTVETLRWWMKKENVSQVLKEKRLVYQKQIWK